MWRCTCCEWNNITAHLCWNSQSLHCVPCKFGGSCCANLWQGKTFFLLLGNVAAALMCKLSSAPPISMAQIWAAQDYYELPRNRTTIQHLCWILAPPSAPHLPTPKNTCSLPSPHPGMTPSCLIPVLHIPQHRSSWLIVAAEAYHRAIEKWCPSYSKETFSSYKFAVYSIDFAGATALPHRNLVRLELSLNFNSVAIHEQLM